MLKIYGQTIKLPDRYNRVDKELLKRTVWFVIDNYYNNDEDLYIDGRKIDDSVPVDLTGNNISITKGNDNRRFSSLDEDKQRLIEYINNADISFAEALRKYIDASGKTDAEIYKNANVTRATFNRIINSDYNTDRPFHISHRIAYALAAALHLTVIETEALLSKAGLTLSLSSKQALIIRYCFENNVYDVMTINGILHFFDQELIGSEG